MTLKRAALWQFPFTFRFPSAISLPSGLGMTIQAGSLITWLWSLQPWKRSCGVPQRSWCHVITTRFVTTQVFMTRNVTICEQHFQNHVGAYICVVNLKFCAQLRVFLCLRSASRMSSQFLPLSAVFQCRSSSIFLEQICWKYWMYTAHSV
jgi:hypothetical protein